MKKLFSIITIITITYLFTSCTFNEAQYISPSSKPKINYYTNEIKDNIEADEE